MQKDETERAHQNRRQLAQGLVAGYGSYVVFELDDDYQHAFVSGYNHDYLWLLARDPVVSPELKARFVIQAKERGFDTDGLIWVKQQ